MSIDLLETYVAWARTYPLTSAATQFAILGTLGEHIPIFVKRKRLSTVYNLPQFILTMGGWGLLGVLIKYGFTGMRGFVGGLLEHQLLPVACSSGIMQALTVSIATNLFFGPQMMFFHRLEENLIMRRSNYAGLQKAWWTLIWFWIPAHTITFALPKDYQIGLAALWSIVLGLILGLT